MPEMFVELRAEINTLVDAWSTRLKALPMEVISARRNSQNRTIRQILGHLIDSAANTHHRIVRLQYNAHLEFPDYRQDNDRWIAIQNYQEEDWDSLVSFWKLYTRHIIHIIGNVREDCLNHTWHDFEGHRETLKTIIEGYLWHLNLHLKEIEALINA
ncbi:MAG: DinB family protein [Syntrophaceae bacterium]